MTKAIKNVSDEAWSEFKALAGLNNMTLGEYFEQMVDNSKKESITAKAAWKNIFALKNKPLIKDARKAKRKARELRQGLKIDI